ncbi:hypothetical protein AB835_03160 [Candidatus Endobugula sertula]|uniref:DUF4178 domain-containing protein n=1 Tax=Candidatus Endobugula sertula TaxID=62101 RepID=A0A1D2QSR1_9GAMM|nr:hypothetical protein AB835_03160 [Candidatus Endobugula sertula]
MKKLFKALFSSDKADQKPRSLDKLSDLHIDDYIKLNDSFALPKELRGKTFQVNSIDSYYYGEKLSVEWTLKGETQKKVYLSLSDLGDEDRIVLSYQLNKKEVETVFGWDNIKQQYHEDYEGPLVCKNSALFEGWLDKEYYRRECAAKAVYFDRDCRRQHQPTGGESLTYYEFYNDDEGRSMDVEIWSQDEIDVFISILRPESDVHEFWPAT